MGWIRAGLSWLVDQAIERWPTIAVVFGGIAMSYLASISAWLEPYGLVAWGAIGIGTILVLSLAYLCVGAALQRVAVSTYTRSKSMVGTANVLAPTHTHERLDLAAFFHPFYKATEDVRFENCELFGPANMVSEGCTFAHCGFIDCEIVIARQDRPIRGGILFRRCLFIRSKLYRVTLVMPYAMYQALPGEMRNTVPVISDGRIGDV
jgi:hypothetical protein